jgi:hypothetical protein
VQAFLAQARQRPELAGVNTTFNANSQQLRADVDREKAMLLQVPVQDVYSAIQAQFGSLTASQFSQYSRVWWVIVQSDAQFRQTPGDLTRLYTRSNQGKMVPLSAVVSTEWTAGPDLLPHFNGFPAAKVIGNAAAGYSSGQALEIMEQLAKETLPLSDPAQQMRQSIAPRAGGLRRVAMYGGMEARKRGLSIGEKPDVRQAVLWLANVRERRADQRCQGDVLLGVIHHIQQRQHVANLDRLEEAAAAFGKGWDAKLEQLTHVDIGVAAHGATKHHAVAVAQRTEGLALAVVDAARRLAIVAHQPVDKGSHIAGFALGAVEFGRFISGGLHHGVAGRFAAG